MSIEMASGDTTDQDYFLSYEDLEVHELMLKDTPRTKAYQNYIEGNKAVFKDKIVVDVGAGTGILSLFAAKAGAKHVYAIEASRVSYLCERIVRHNGLSGHITVLHGRAEDVTLPGDVQADVLISEWMGFYLLHESMLGSVISARNRFLKSDGIILPSSATIYLCPVSMKTLYDEKFRFWNNVHGFDFAPVLPHVKAGILSSPKIEVLNPDQCLANPEEVLNLNLKFVEVEDLRKIHGRAKFSLTKNGLLHGLACWFAVEFEGVDMDCVLKTGPDSKETHWKQTVILLPEPLLVNKGEEIICNVLFEQSPDYPRRYNISIEIPDDDDADDVKNDDQVATTQMIVDAMHQGT